MTHSDFCSFFADIQLQRMAERTSVFSDFKLTRENDDLLSSRRKYIFEYTIMRIPNKSIRQTWFVLFEVLSLELLGVDHFSRYRTKIYEKQRSYKVRNFNVPD